MRYGWWILSLQRLLALLQKFAAWWPWNTTVAGKSVYGWMSWEAGQSPRMPLMSTLYSLLIMLVLKWVVILSLDGIYLVMFLIYFVSSGI